MMTNKLCSLVAGAALLALAGAAYAAEPLKLSSGQMDKVIAGWDLFEIVSSNTSGTLVSIYQQPTEGNPGGNLVGCSSCYLIMSNPTFSVASFFGHP
jgi:hypothetical protein